METTKKKRKVYNPAATYERNNRWTKENMTRYTVSFHNVNDADIIEKLASVESKRDYIRQLIRADIKRTKDAEFIKSHINNL